MTTVQNDLPTSQKQLRLWPGVVAAVLLSLVTFGLPIFAPDQGGTAILGGVACGVAIIVWWLFFSRAPWPDRIGAIVLMAVAVAVTRFVVHKSIANGMMGMMLPIFSIPILSLALVAAVAAGRRFSGPARRALVVVAILLGCGVFTLLRTGGMTGDANSDLHWRWTKTPEELLLAQSGKVPVSAAAIAMTPEPEEPVSASAGSEPTPTPEATEAAKPHGDWPGFRGAAR
ncbi:MAG: hypothetical protein KA368_18960, partial [Acidobacteria bacterium]|nr:hypothetical protein [Acidobacteriota bacterium]